MSDVQLAHPGSSIVLTTNQILLATWSDRSQSSSSAARLGADRGCSANARTDCEDGYHPGHIYISDLRSYPDTHTSVLSLVERTNTASHASMFNSPQLSALQYPAL